MSCVRNDVIVDINDNIIDYSSAGNDSIRLFANMLFSKPVDTLSSDLTGILVDDDMLPIDVFCMMIELIIYGMHILTGKTWFDVPDSTDDIIYLIKKYLRSIGFNMTIHQVIVAEEDVLLYRDRDDYFCQLLKKPHQFLCHGDWFVMDYRIINNPVFDESVANLDNLEAFLINNNNQILTIKFSLIQH